MTHSYECDKCKNFFTWFEFVGKKPGIYEHEIHLCNECYKLFIKWLKQELDEK